MWDKLAKEKLGRPTLPAMVPSAAECFSSLDFSDVCAEAKMVSVCHWLRGGTNLQIPDAFRTLLPQSL